MIGAIIGDIVGSRFEFAPHKDKIFEFFNEKCRFTDDTVMTLAVAKSLLEADSDYDNLSEITIKNMQTLGRKYSNAGYGGRFARWINDKNPMPYNSFGNGSAMRISAVAYVGKTLEEVKSLSYKVTSITHNHPEGLKGAEAVAVAIFLARTGKSKEEIKDYLENNYYRLDFTLDEIRGDYTFHVDSMQSVPQAIKCFLEADNFEDSIRNAVSLGGDSDTMGAIAGAIAEAYYGDIGGYNEYKSYLDEYMLDIIFKFRLRFCR